MDSEHQGLVFVIDGNEYPAPTLDTFDMAERRLLYELSKITQEDLVREDDESEEDHDRRVTMTLRHPGFMETLMQVAYARGNPALKPDKVRAIIERTNYLEAIQKWAEEEDAGPPDRTSPSELSKHSESENGSSSERSGESSSTTSDRPDRLPASTGTSESATSSQPLAPVA